MQSSATATVLPATAKLIRACVEPTSVQQMDECSINASLDTHKTRWGGRGATLPKLDSTERQPLHQVMLAANASAAVV